jgi:competence protein ComEC
VTAPGGTILVPGDIERGSEERLLVQGLDLRADILVAPHHGSRTSSVAPFVESVRPSAVIFTTGYRNRFGHPHAEVVERWSRTGAALHRTDRDGAVLVAMSTPGRMRVERYRALHRRYWLEAPAEVSTPAAAEGPFN